MTLDELCDLNIALEDAKRTVWAAQRLVAAAIVAKRETEPVTHDYAPPQHVAPFCAGLHDDPPSTPA